tara:strand:- start:2236 stop:2859 length:624 start_codon:yes stop_codon:yes gene_type:complete
MKKKVAIINYGMGNLRSVEVSLNYLGVKNKLIDNANNLKFFTHIILPGVGSFNIAVKNLKKTKLFHPLIKLSKNKKIKILGICLGMQLLFSSSTEDGYCEGLNIIEGKVEKFSKKELGLLKIPHVGFNQILTKKKIKFFENIKNQSDFYFDHSYRIKNYNNKIDSVTSNYGIDFLSAFAYNNIYGTQFHPEKSQSNGLKLLKNFIES